MTDTDHRNIVERLLASADGADTAVAALLREAAGEIERMREALGWPPLLKHPKRAAEIEQLRRNYPYSELDMDMHVEAVTKELRAEIERLRAALGAIHDLCKTSPANPFLADDMDRTAISALEAKP